MADHRVALDKAIWWDQPEIHALMSASKEVVHSDSNDSSTYQIYSDSDSEGTPEGVDDKDAPQGGGTGNMPIDDVFTVRFNTHVVDFSDNSLYMGTRGSHSEVDRLSDDGLSYGGRPVSETDMQLVL